MKANFAPAELIIQRFKRNEKGEKQKNYKRIIYPMEKLDITEFEEKPIHFFNLLMEELHIT